MIKLFQRAQLKEYLYSKSYYLYQQQLICTPVGAEPIKYVDNINSCSNTTTTTISETTTTTTTIATSTPTITTTTNSNK